MKSDIFPPTSETTVMHQEDDLFTPKQCLQQYFYVDTGGLPSVLMNNLYNTHTQVRLLVFSHRIGTLAPTLALYTGNPFLWHHQLLVFLI